MGRKRKRGGEKGRGGRERKRGGEKVPMRNKTQGKG